MDNSLVALGGLLVVSLVIAMMWHAIVRSYPLAIFASAFTAGLVTYVTYPMFRGVAPSPLILSDVAILSATIALGVGIPFKRWRAGKVRRGNDA